MSAATPPVPGYEGPSVAEPRERVRSLAGEEVRELVAYEESHADRTEVLELLKDRLEGTEGEDGLSGGAGPEGGPDPADGTRADAVPRSAERPPPDRRPGRS